MVAEFGLVLHASHHQNGHCSSSFRGLLFLLPEADVVCDAILGNS
jgi:hypothetical protein